MAERLPPTSFIHEREKIEPRWPAAVEYIRRQRLNEQFGPSDGEVRAAGRRLMGRRDAAEWVRKLREAALADEEGAALEQAMQSFRGGT